MTLDARYRNQKFLSNSVMTGPGYNMNKGRQYDQMQGTNIGEQFNNKDPAKVTCPAINGGGRYDPRRANATV